MTSTTTASVAARPPAHDVRPLQVVAVADSDSYLKWGAATLDRLSPDCATTVLLLRSRITPTSAQVAAATAGTRFAASEPRIVTAAGLARELARLDPDVLLVSTTGPPAELVLEIASRTASRPVLVTGLPGMALPATVKALRFRARCDVLVTHSRRERREYTALAEGIGLAPVVALARLPFLPERVRADVAGSSDEVRRVVFAPQAKVPSARGQRERVLLALAALARSRPDVDVVVKLRAVAGEQQTHDEMFPYDALWKDLELAGHVVSGSVRFASGPLADQLGPGAALVTVSSTAALEAVADGRPTLVIDDFGLNERMLNAAFLGSGCVGGLDDLAAGRFGRLAVAWGADNYLHPEEDDLRDVLEDLVARRRAGTLPATEDRTHVARRRRRRRLVRAAARSTLPQQLLMAAGIVRHPVSSWRRRTA